VGVKAVFNVGGNHYRIVGLPHFDKRRLFLLWAGTHEEYDKLDVRAL
jgi:mRNA interferase HigB